MTRTAVVVFLLLAATVSTVRETVLVDSVIPGSPAAAAGVRAGDRIVAIDGRKIAAEDDLHEVLSSKRPGDAVSLTVGRDDETVDLTLTLGARPGGGVLMGVALEVVVDPGGEIDEGTRECLAWIEKTYRIDSMLRELGLDLSGDHETIRACVARDTRRMATADAIRYCDNIFKIHCSALDLLLEIGEAQADRCERLLDTSLAPGIAEYPAWRTCARNTVIDRYSLNGAPGGEKECRAVFLNECGKNIGPAIEAEEVSPEQRRFVECCSAPTLEPRTPGAAARCGMLGDGFARGPCRDRRICVNRDTGDWLHCPVPQ